MSFFKLIGLIVELLVLYFRNKRDKKKMKVEMMKKVNKATQDFAEDVVSGDEDGVSKKLDDLLNEYDLRKKD